VRLGSALRGPRRAESSSFVAVMVHPFPMRPRSHRRHAAPLLEPETWHPEFDDEPLESQIERASFPLLPFVQLHPEFSQRLEPQQRLQFEHVAW